MKLKEQGETLKQASLKSGMSEKTARKYLRSGKTPQESKTAHTWRTRRDPFGSVWREVEEQLELNPGLHAKTLFRDLQRRHPGKYPAGQLRTFQRRVKHWRALRGAGKEAYFPQRHQPGKQSQSDFTHLSSLGVTLNGQRFDHLLYHFVLPYSNWETGTICFSESFESLSEGLQNALFKLGGVPLEHQTDRLSAAVRNLSKPEAFTPKYESLLSHYGMKGRKIQAGRANENGDIEQSHHRFKQALDQSLLLRGSRDFSSREEYAAFMETVFDQLNGDRRDRIREEFATLKALPARRLNASRLIQARVAPSSTITVRSNVYSVHSRLIGERVDVRLSSESLEIWYGQSKLETLPRLSGKGNHRVNYRHIIDWLVRKPGAFENYIYRDDLFPTSRFRMAYDSLKTHSSASASREYLKILELAAKETESGVDESIRSLIHAEEAISFDAVRRGVESRETTGVFESVEVASVDLSSYDELFECEEVAL